MSTQSSGPPASGLQSSNAGFCPFVPTGMRTLTLHAHLLSVYLSDQYMAVLVLFLSPPWSFQTQQGAAFHSPSWSPFSCFMPPDYCGHLGLHVLTPLCRRSPPSWPTEHSRWLQLKPGHLLCSLPGHSSPRGIRLSSKDSLV